eukprot:CAMPEP_0194290662 /NCGR_PEP_ID=MMETSP0169-20130528/41779_1 /TAXON_ID=218684 /ORGANISM="Corethron pennatum, Strain L29A3" /LENGTH=578 /DNA_ID=CAMNT_0039038321 /DNA_START=41 /DNA_END=1773 /DNA_ORIENTATION=+
MVKRQKEKLYQSAREYRANTARRINPNADRGATSVGVQRNLPFGICALSLNKISVPVCIATSNVVFDNASIVPYLMKHGVDPVTGKCAAVRDLIQLNIEKDERDRWQCPILCKPFNDHSRVVAILQGDGTANVYSKEAVDELNVRARNWTDLVTGRSFSKKDVLVLQNPDDASHRDINNFVHIKDRRLAHRPSTSRDEVGGDDNTKKSGGAAAFQFSGNVRHNSTACRILEKVAAETAKRKIHEEEKKKVAEAAQLAAVESSGKGKKKRPAVKVYTDDLVGGYKQHTAAGSGSLTCTGMAVARGGERREATEKEIFESTLLVVRKMKKKGYVQIETNLGNLNVEVHCDLVPRTAANFIGLASLGKYEGSIFHRNIPNFMIQGGAPPGKTKGGESVWGGSFADEFDDRLKHDGRGVLSMANSGPGTNKSQFFITFDSCGHLDRKHSVFGKVVGGLEVLKSMEEIETDKKDRPRTEIQILRTNVFVDPITEAEDVEHLRYEKARENEKQKTTGRDRAAQKKIESIPVADPLTAPAVADNNRIGKYIPISKLKNIDEAVVVKKKEGKSHRAKATTYGDFSS